LPEAKTFGAFVTREYKIAVIGGDGIGPEVTAIALEAINKVTAGSGVDFKTTEFDLGARRYLASGETLTDADLANLAEHDAILLGAIGDPRVTSGILERQLLLKLRFTFDHFVNLRPTKLYPGVVSPLADPGKIDFVVVREGTEGLYVGNGGAIRVGTEHEVANEVSVNTAYGVERLVRYAFEVAVERDRKKLTLVHKHNVLIHAGSLWQRTVDRIAEEFPSVKVDYQHVDAAMIFMATDPERFDVIVTDNLFGDILTDLAAAIGGGIGLGASGNINPTGKYPSMFEPIHGSAPDIAGKNLADPTAAILSASMLLEHLGQYVAAARIENAVAGDLATRGTAKRSTTEVAQSILALL
jgi:3-isopropylmalate dehydrogenase